MDIQSANNTQPKNFKEVQQDLTELNGDGNRTRGRYGEDYEEMVETLGKVSWRESRRD